MRPVFVCTLPAVTWRVWPMTGCGGGSAFAFTLSSDAILSSNIFLRGESSSIMPSMSSTLFRTPVSRVSTFRSFLVNVAISSARSCSSDVSSVLGLLTTPSSAAINSAYSRFTSFINSSYLTFASIGLARSYGTALNTLFQATAAASFKNSSP